MSDRFSAPLVRCPHCGQVLGGMEDGSLKIRVRSRIVVVKGGSNRMATNCMRCHKSVTLPFLVQTELKS